MVCPIGHICKDKINDYECVCPEGWEGDNCERNIDYCATNPCLNDGNCTSNTKTYSCICLNGFTGRNCETGLTSMALKKI